MRQATQDQSFPPQILKKLKRTDQLADYFQNLTQRRKGLQLFNLLSTKNNIIYLDQQKQYAIVQVSYLQNLQNNSQSLQTQIKQVLQNIQNQHKNKAAFNKLLSLKDKQIKQMTQLYENMVNRVKQLQKVLNDTQAILNKNQMHFQYLAYQNQQLAMNNRSQRQFYRDNNVNKWRNKQDKSIQTQLQLQFIKQNNNLRNQGIFMIKSNQQIQSKNKIQGKQKYKNKSLQRYHSMNEDQKLSINQLLIKQHQQQILELKQNFEKVLQKITKQVNNKLLQLQSDKLNVQKWVNQNKQLRKQNQQLKQKIRIINQQQQKLKIWKNTLQSFVENAQNSHLQANKIINQFFKDPSIELDPNNNNSISSNFTTNFLLKQKLTILQSIIDRLNYQQQQKNNKLKQIRKILDQEANNVSNVSDENIVGNLLMLSAKLKDIVRILLEEI